MEQQLSFPMRYQQNDKAENVAIVVPSPHTRFNYRDNDIIKLLRRKDYAVVIAPTVEDVPQLTLDYWATGLSAAYYKMGADSLLPVKVNQLVLIGFEEGGYLLPSLARLLEADTYIAINTGPHSPLRELLIALEDTTISTEPFQKAYQAIDEQELLLKTTRLLENPYQEVFLGDRPNAYWLSFYQDPTYPRLTSGFNKGHYLIFENYPLISANNRVLLQSALPKEPQRKVNFAALPGTGNLRSEEEMERLKQKVEAILNSLH